MTYKGRIQGGTVVLEPGIELPDGLEVRVGVGPADATEELLEEPSLDDAMDKLHLLYKIRRGTRQADAGQTVSHAEARKRLARWLE